MTTWARVEASRHDHTASHHLMQAPTSQLVRKRVWDGELPLQVACDHVHGDDELVEVEGAVRLGHVGELPDLLQRRRRRMTESEDSLCLKSWRNDHWKTTKSPGLRSSSNPARVVHFP